MSLDGKLQWILIGWADPQRGYWGYQPTKSWLFSLKTTSIFTMRLFSFTIARWTNPWLRKKNNWLLSSHSDCLLSWEFVHNTTGIARWGKSLEKNVYNLLLRIHPELHWFLSFLKPRSKHCPWDTQLYMCVVWLHVCIHEWLCLPLLVLHFLQEKKILSLTIINKSFSRPSFWSVLIKLFGAKFKSTDNI